MHIFQCYLMEKAYFTEGFIDENQLLTHNFTRRKLTASKIKGSGLISLDACVTPQIQSLFDGTKFYFKTNKFYYRID